MNVQKILVGGTVEGRENHGDQTILVRRFKICTWLFILGLVISGATAIPLVPELDWLVKSFPTSPGSTISEWLDRVRTSLHTVQDHHPFLFYGTDWLAFGHFAIAIAFIGALRDPVRNKWLFDFGLIACALVLPYALVFGALRGIPLWWRLIDCSFGLVGAVPLALCRKWTRDIEHTIPGNNRTRPGNQKS